MLGTGRKRNFEHGSASNLGVLTVDIEVGVGKNEICMGAGN